jgi:hypothetical protein
LTLADVLRDVEKLAVGPERPKLGG